MKNIIILVDRSESVGEKRLNEVKSLLKIFIPCLILNGFQITLFRNSDHTQPPIGPTDKENDLFNFLDSTQVEKVSILFPTLIDTIKSAEMCQDCKTIIFMSDGEVGIKEPTDQWLNQIRTTNIKIYTFGIGEINNIFHDVLQEIANKSKGHYYRGFPLDMALHKFSKEILHIDCQLSFRLHLQQLRAWIKVKYDLKKDKVRGDEKRTHRTQLDFASIPSDAKGIILYENFRLIISRKIPGQIGLIKELDREFGRQLFRRKNLQLYVFKTIWPKVTFTQFVYFLPKNEKNCEILGVFSDRELCKQEIDILEDMIQDT
ncbi:MAG: vWA domain-containing protein [bacterium]